MEWRCGAVSTVGCLLKLITDYLGPEIRTTVSSARWHTHVGRRLSILRWKKRLKSGSFDFDIGNKPYGTRWLELCRWSPSFSAKSKVIDRKMDEERFLHSLKKIHLLEIRAQLHDWVRARGKITLITLYLARSSLSHGAGCAEGFSSSTISLHLWHYQSIFGCSS